MTFESSKELSRLLLGYCVPIDDLSRATIVSESYIYSLREYYDSLIDIFCWVVFRTGSNCPI